MFWLEVLNTLLEIFCILIQHKVFSPNMHTAHVCPLFIRVWVRVCVCVCVCGIRWCLFEPFYPRREWDIAQRKLNLKQVIHRHTHIDHRLVLSRDWRLAWRKSVWQRCTCAHAHIYTSTLRKHWRYTNRFLKFYFCTLLHICLIHAKN